jgi:hypothetical protein
MIAQHTCSIITPPRKENNRNTEIIQKLQCASYYSQDNLETLSSPFVDRHEYAPGYYMLSLNCRARSSNAFASWYLDRT